MFIHMRTSTTCISDSYLSNDLENWEPFFGQFCSRPERLSTELEPQIEHRHLQALAEQRRRDSVSPFEWKPLSGLGGSGTSAFPQLESRMIQNSSQHMAALTLKPKSPNITWCHWCGVACQRTLKLQRVLFISDHKIHAPPPQNQRSIRREQKLGVVRILLCSLASTIRTPPPLPQKIPPDEEGLLWGWCVVGSPLSLGDGCWLSVLIHQQARSRSTWNGVRGRDVAKQKSVKRSAFSLNAGKAFSHKMHNHP